MKNILLISFLIIFNISYAQVEKDDAVLLNTSLFETNIEESNLLSNSKSINIFPDFIKLELKDIKNNSEGKFLLNTSKEKFFKSDVVKSNTTLITQNTSIQNVNNSKPSIQKELVDKIIRKKINEEIQDYISTNEALTYGDRNLDMYRNYSNSENKLLRTYTLSSEVEVQIGKDIIPYLNKVLKTELDKTLQNSINLLVVNF